MGRTLHYSIEKDRNFTDVEATRMFEISKKYDSIKKDNKSIWTCEGFWLDPYNCLPNWNTQGGKAESNEQINSRYDELQKQGLFHVNIVKQLDKEQLVVLSSDNKSKARGYTKTQGNEFNSLLVYMALIEISQAIPKAKIHLFDEGEFLFCSLWIQAGKVLPDIADLNNQIKRWASIKTLTGKTAIMNKLNKTIVKDMNKDIKSMFNLDGSYSKYADRYLEECLNKAKIVGHIISENWTYAVNRRYVQITEYNIEDMPVEFWFRPELFCRCFDLEALAEDFEDYGKDSFESRLMGGFDGEYYGLVPEGTEEVNSYKNIAFIHKILEGAGAKKENIVTGKEI